MFIKEKIVKNRKNCAETNLSFLEKFLYFVKGFIC